MIENAREVITAWTAKILASPELAKEIGGTVNIIVDGSGGGSWLFYCQDKPRVIEGSDAADCKLIISDSDLVGIANGTLNPQMAFAQGKIKLEGDMMLALRLSALF